MNYEEEEIVTETTELYEVIETDDIITLIVKNVKPINSGNYYALLVNDAGQLSTNKAQLTVNSQLNSFNYCMFTLKLEN